MKIKNLTQVMHYFAKQFVQHDSLIVDATCGNGNDTLWLATTFTNPILACDIQPQAIKRTRQRCKACSNIDYILADHQQIAKFINKPISFSVLNLGYLPHSTSTLTTKADTTIKCIDTLLTNTIAGGGMVISIYTAHDHHNEEQKLLPYLKELDKTQYLVVAYQFQNLDESPYLIIIEKKSC